MSVLDRIFAKCVPVGECLEWRGRLNDKGYGKIQISKKRKLVHRLVAEAFGHNIEGLKVCHHCDNPPCCNPSHLFVGTQQDNIRDCIKKGRHVNPRHQKLSIADILAIKNRIDAGDRLILIAADFCVSYQHIYRISRGKIWADIK